MKYYIINLSVSSLCVNGFQHSFDWLGAKILFNTGELDGSVPCAELAQLAGTHQGAAAGQSAPTPVCGTYCWAIQSYLHITEPGSKTLTSMYQKAGRLSLNPEHCN
jgi:hypothetical protein